MSDAENFVGTGGFFVMRVSVMSLTALHVALGIPKRKCLPEVLPSMEILKILEIATFLSFLEPQTKKLRTSLAVFHPE